MHLSDRLLFWVPALVWASTWHVILFQLDSPVPPLTSVGWRFALASALLVAWALWRRESLRLPARAHPWMMLAGVVQYGFNYVSVYLAEQHIPSGLVAVLFSMMVFGNSLTGWWFFGRRVSARFLGAAAAGVLGVALVFWPELSSAGERPQAWMGLGLGLIGVVAAVAGNVLTLRLTQDNTPLIPVLAWSMGYGALALLGVSAMHQGQLPFDTRLPYVLSLVYLAAAGSVLAFVLYFKLAQRQGPGRAALMGVIIPVIALAVSALLEGWKLTPVAALGMALCLGSVWVASRAR
jgi:drug/metabolite transporter (DMT)-like permease